MSKPGMLDVMKDQPETRTRQRAIAKLLGSPSSRPSSLLSGKQLVQMGAQEADTGISCRNRKVVQGGEEESAKAQERFPGARAAEQT
jgi:hypothetical protein